MKKYECLYIVNINFDSEGISAVVGRLEEVLKNVGAEVVNTQHWGKRKLAYAIDKERYGNYVLVHFQGENPDISELAREFEIESGVLHYMTIRLDEFPDFETLVVPQAFETERGRRPSTRDSRSSGDEQKPRRYVEDDQADDEDESTDDGDDNVDSDDSGDGKASADAAPETESDDTPSEEAEKADKNAGEASEEAEAEEAEKADKNAEEAPEKAEVEGADEPEAADADSEESVDEAPEEEADKPADSE